MLANKCAADDDDEVDMDDADDAPTQAPESG